MIWKREVYLRVCDGLTAVLLALRKKPLIRYIQSVCERECVLYVYLASKQEDITNGAYYVFLV